MIRANMTRPAVSVAILTALLGCAGGNNESGRTNNPVIAETRGGPVHLDEYLYYVRSLYPELSGEIDDDIHSRIFHAFLRELVSAEFQRVTDEEVEAVVAGNLEMANQIPLLSPQDQEMRRRLLRRRLAVRQLLMREIQEAAAVPDEEVARYYQDHEEQYKRDARYTLRFVQTADKTQADALRKALAASKDPFTRVAEPFAVNDGHLVAVAMSLDELPEPFAEALNPGKRGALKPGQYSRVIPLKQGESESYYVLYLESIIEAVQQPLEEVYFHIREQLERERAVKLFNQKVKRFREKIPVKVHADKLPFTYTEPDTQDEV